MRFRVFPCDLEGVGCYRIIYPYGQIDANTSCEVVMTIPDGPLVDEHGATRLQVPPAAVGGPHDETAGHFLDADVFVLQRPLDRPYAPLAAWLKSHGKMVVVDLDDWMHGIPTTNPAHRQLMKSHVKSLKVLEHVLRYTDLLTVTTERLGELYGRYVPRVAVLPNRLLRKDWDAVAPAYTLDRARLRVGWMGWMAWRGSDLKVLKPVLRRFLRRHPEAVFVNVGKPDTLTYLALPKNQVMHVPGARFPGHALPTSMIDIGLVPLARNEFNECKSSLKGQEYGAAGACVIASSTGPYRDWVEPGVNGYLASTVTEWDAALEDAATGWRTLAEANHAKSMRHLIDDHYPDWLTPYGLEVAA